MITETLAYQLTEEISGISPTKRENAARVPTPVITDLKRSTSSPPVRINFELYRQEKDTIPIIIAPIVSEFVSNVNLCAAIISQTGQAILAVAPTLVLERGSESPRS